MRMRSTLLLILASAALSGCAASTASSPDLTTYAGALEAAQLRQAEARERGHAWNTVEPLLSQAAAANDAGDEEEAIRLANEARLHAELSIEQAEFESEAWKTRAGFE